MTNDHMAVCAMISLIAGGHRPTLNEGREGEGGRPIGSMIAAEKNFNPVCYRTEPANAETRSRFGETDFRLPIGKCADLKTIFLNEIFQMDSGFVQRIAPAIEKAT